MTTHGSFPRQIFAGCTPFWVPNFGTKNGRFCWQCLCSSDPYGESMNSNVHKNKSESIQKRMKIGLWVEIWFDFSHFSQKMRQDEKTDFWHFLGGVLETWACAVTFRPWYHWVSIVDWRDFRVLKLCFQKTRIKSASHCQIKMEWLKDDWLNKWNVVLQRHFH